MKHAGPAALDRLGPLLRELRAAGGLQERSHGVFYRRGRAFLHFHEDPAGLFADLRAAEGSAFERFDVTDAEGQRTLVAAVQARA